MRLAILLYAVLMLAAVGSAQSYTIELREAGPHMVTPNDPVGVAVDTLELSDELIALEAQMLEVRIEEQELALYKRTHAIHQRQAFLRKVLEKTRQACASQ